MKFSSSETYDPTKKKQNMGRFSYLKATELNTIIGDVDKHASSGGLSDVSLDFNMYVLCLILESIQGVFRKFPKYCSQMRTHSRCFICSGEPQIWIHIGTLLKY